VLLFLHVQAQIFYRIHIQSWTGYSCLHRDRSPDTGLFDPGR
jgi:hypothetical protein